MKRIKDGKLYDTATAELLRDWSNSYYRNDFKYRSKILYRTEKGAFFLLHEGGPMTDMAVPAGSGATSGSSRIEIISREDAIKFLESHGGEEVLIDEFPDYVEPA